MNNKPFIYGMSVEGDNFTDREIETKRLKLNFENGINSILISPRRMGKTSLVKKVISMIDEPKIKVVYMDIYKCRTEFDFYEKFASSIIQATTTKIDSMVENAKKFITSITPKIAFSPDINAEFTLSLGIDKHRNSAEEILELPEKIAKDRGIHIVVCIDEFQQIGEIPNSLSVQRAIRSVWQHQQNVSYCLFGSKQHLMSNLFYSRKMPFYQFGDMFFLKRIPTDKWVPFIIGRFQHAGKEIDEVLATKICETVENYSSYVQQLAWNVLAVRTYQLNLLRAICVGIHSDFSKKETTSLFDLGTRSNVPKIIKALTEREIIERNENGIFIADPLFKLWFKREMM